VSAESEQIEQENLHEEEEVRPDQALTLRQIFGEKLMDVGSMDRMIRWVTGLGIAQILVAVLLIGLNLIDMPKIGMTDASGGGYQLAIPIIIACTAFMAMAWTWLFVGALHARLLIRIPVLLIFYGLHLFLIYEHQSTVTGWIFLVLSALYAFWHGRARPAGYGRDLLVVGFGIAFTYLALVDQYRFSNPGQQYIVMLVSIQVVTLSFLLMPMFSFAGLDLGESVRDIARWVIGQGAARSKERPLLWVALGLSAAKLAWMLGRGEFTPGWVAAALLWVTIAYMAVRMKPWLGLHHEPQFGLVFTLTVGSFVAVGLLLVANGLLHMGLTSDSMAWWGLGLVGVVSATAAIVMGWGRSAAGRRTAAAFLMILSLWALFRAVGAFSVLGHWPVRYGLNMEEMDGALVLLLPILLLYLWLRGLATRSVSAWAISLTVGLSAIRGMLWLVDNNYDLPAAAAAAQLAVMAAGLIWDVLTSGDKFTNQGSDRVPRFARVLLYFGYVSLSTTAMLFYKGSGFQGTFDDDMLAVNGLMIIGFPIFLYGFARSGVMLVRQAWERKDEAA
jgi:hypothetical protein